MKIVHLILTRRFAGSERYAVELANMQAREHDVTLVLLRNAADDRVDAIARRVDGKVKIIYVSNFKPLAVWQARRAVKKLSPDVSHAHLSWGCRVLSKLESGAGIRVATLHITYKPKQHQRLDGLIAIAPWQLPLLPARLIQRAVHIDNWSFPVAPSDNARQQLRQRHNIPEDSPVFGTLGRLDRSKGLDVVIDAFNKAAIPGARLVIVGAGKAQPELAKRAGSNVLFAGYTTVPQDWLAAFDVFVSAARSEPFGLVFLEAMNARLPIIASASEGACHLVQNIGRPLIEIDDVDGFVKAMRDVVQDGCRRLEYNLDAFNPEARCSDIVAFYRELSDLHAGSPN